MPPFKDSAKWAKTQLIWRHNSFLGHCSMAKQNMKGIIKSPTTTDAAKETASKIILQLDTLYKELKTRKD